jgi:catechol-2,3-dioxygenase
VELTQIRLLVSDFTAGFRFYRDVLGLSPEPADERDRTLVVPEGNLIELQQWLMRGNAR